MHVLYRLETCLTLLPLCIYGEKYRCFGTWFSAVLWCTYDNRFFNNIFAILIHFVITQVSPLSFTSWPLPLAFYVLKSCVQYMTILHYTCDNRIWSDLSNDKKSTIFKQMFFKLSFETTKIKKAPLKNQGPRAEIFWSVYSWKTFKLSHYCNISKQSSYNRSHIIVQSIALHLNFSQLLNWKI